MKKAPHIQKFKFKFLNGGFHICKTDFVKFLYLPRAIQSNLETMGMLFWKGKVDVFLTTEKLNDPQ